MEIARDLAGKVLAREEGSGCARGPVSPDPRALPAGMVAAPDAGAAGGVVVAAAARPEGGTVAGRGSGGPGGPARMDASGIEALREEVRALAKRLDGLLPGSDAAK